MNWQERVYYNIMKVWMGKAKKGEKFSAIDIGNMLMRDLQTGRFYQNLLNATEKSYRLKFRAFWLRIYWKLFPFKEPRLHSNVSEEESC